MRIYGKIETAFWQNTKIRKLSCEAKLLYAYILACPHGNSIGCFRLPLGYMMDDLDWGQDDCLKHVSELVSSGLVTWSKDHKIIRIIGWFGHNTFENKNVAKGAIKALEALPECQEKQGVLDELKRVSNVFINELLYSIEPPEPEPEPEPNQKPEPEYKTILFNEFWDAYPRQRRGNKQKAIKAYEKAISEKRATEQQILDGVLAYGRSSEVANGYAKGAEAWLNDDRWANEYHPPGGNGYNGGGNGAQEKIGGTVGAYLTIKNRWRSEDGGGGV